MSFLPNWFSQNLNSTRLIRSLVPLLLLIFASVSAAQTNNIANYATMPAGLAPGAPAGSYALSELESINVYNGGLNVAVPLLKVRGRGEGGYTITVRIRKSPWTALSQLYGNCGGSIDPGGGPGTCFWDSLAHDEWWTPVEPGYDPGVLQGHWVGSDPDVCEGHSDPTYARTFTTITFTAPDGSEHYLYDEKTGGTPVDWTCNTIPDYGRGRIFSAKDGSGLTFVSDLDINDATGPSAFHGVFFPSGYLKTKDGTVYRFVWGRTEWLRDRNGNQLTFTYDNSGYTPAYRRLTRVTDSLDRQINIYYNVQDGQYGNDDQIVYRGFGGAERVIRVSRTSMSNAFRPNSGYQTKTYYQLFPQLPSSSPTYFNPSVVSAVWLPDGSRHFQFYFDEYNELARLELPTGGAVEYDYWAGVSSAYASGQVGESIHLGQPRIFIYRRLHERRLYPDGSSLSTKTIYGRSNSDSRVTVDQLNALVAGDQLIGRENHYFFGDAAASMYAALWGVQDGVADPLEGKELKTEQVSTDGNDTVLSRIEFAWEPGWIDGPPNGTPWSPFVRESVTSLWDSTANQYKVAKQSFTFDQYNNQTDVYEYDYGAGSPGALVRHTQTNFVPASNYTDAVTGAHLRGLPTQMSVYDSGGVERRRTTLEYDNYAPDGGNHAAPVDRPGISGLDSGFSPSYITRGNATAATHYLLLNGSVTGSIMAYAQFDIAGNVVKAIDARGYAITFDYRDNFGASDEVVQSTGEPANVPPTDLAGQISYAFPFKVTNALGHTAYSKYDYNLGRPVGNEDANGTISSTWFSDSLDRPTQVRRAVGTGIQSQISFSYDDVNRIVTTTSDQTANNDNALKSQTLFDGLGRANETRQYESSSTYITTKRNYDALGRPYQASNPYRAGETVYWTTTGFDALGRMISVTTPDNAVVTTAYSGNRVLVKDQAGKERVSKTDGLGRLKDVWEITAADSATETVTFPNHDEVTDGYHTSYEYDVLDSLTKVTQSTQSPREFSYDSFKRLTSATSPESGTINYQYDNNGNLEVKTDARGVSAHYAYDELNRVARRWYNGSSSTSYTTNNSPNLPSGVGASDEINYFYDSQSLPSGAPSSASPDSYSRGYSTGRLVAVTYGGGSTGDYYGYDAAGRSVLQIQRTGSVNYRTSASYNVAGTLLTETYPSQRTVTNTYDGAGRTTSVTGYLGDNAQRTYSAGILYDAASRMTKEQFGTTTTPIYNKLLYNVRGQLAEIREGTTYTGQDDTGRERGSVINSYSDTCSGLCSGHTMTDNNGNLKQQDHWIPDANGNPSAIFTQQYDYDSLNRLQRVVDNRSNPTWRQEYTYDRWGNRTINQTNTFGNGIPKPDFSVNPNNNQLGVPSGQSGTMTYDSAGNLTIDTHSALAILRAYDAENRMTKETQTNSYDAGIYSYDGDGRRVKRIVNGVETWQVYGIGGELLAEYPANVAASSPQKEYGYRNGQLLITTETGAANAPAPSTLTATPPTSGAVVTLNWTAASGATRYRVERKGAGGSFASAGMTVTTSFNDSDGSNGSAYLYKVCAADGAGNCTSAYSNVVLGARFNFPTDPTITTIVDDPSGANVTPMKLEHITDLRTAVNAVRSLAGLSAATWAQPTLTRYVTQISKDDLQELRDRLDEALTALGVQTSVYDDSTLVGAPNGTLIRGVHIRQLRQRATSGVGGSGGSGGSGFQIHWLVSDQLGTPRMIFDQGGSLTVTDQNGNYVSGMTRQDYLRFGEGLGQGISGRTQQQGYMGDGTRQKFTSKERDNETGLDYFGARYYGSTQGRFTSPDPLLSSGKPTEPQSWNRYSYCINNPLVYVDPSGMTITWLQDKNGTNYIGIEDEKIIKQYLSDGWTRVQFDKNGEYSYKAMYYEPRDGTSSIGTYTLCQDGSAYWKERPITEQEMFENYIRKQRENAFAETILGLAAGFALGPLFEEPVSGPGETPTELPTTANDSPSFLGQETGGAIPVPEGASGPGAVRSGNGFMFRDGAGGNGLAQEVNSVRVMNPTSRYPNGYVNYGKRMPDGSWQSVHPYTGKPIPKNSSWWHIPMR